MFLMLVLRKSSKCADSATDKITQSPYSLRSVTTILSEVPVSLTFGSVPCGADRDSVKNFSEDSDYVLCLMADLADLPEVLSQLVFILIRQAM